MNHIMHNNHIVMLVQTQSHKQTGVPDTITKGGRGGNRRREEGMNVVQKVKKAHIRGKR